MIKKILYTILVVCLSACCTKRQTTTDNDIASANSFWGNVFEDLCKQSNKENICLSPLSAQFAMAMLANGAEGETKEEICKALGSYADINAHYNNLFEESNASKECEVNIANSIWINDKLSVKEQFITKNKDYYNAAIEVTPFNKNTLLRINNWCKDMTNGKITSILSDIKPGDRMYLINALYFNADWNKPFNKENTKKENFTTEKGKVVEVDMMTANENSLYYNDEQVEMTVKRYKGNYSMILALPKENVKCSDVAHTLLQDIDKYLSDMNMYNVKLSLPKFTTEFGSSLKDVLEQQGITRAFSHGAELKGISDAPLCVDDIIQKTYVNVDEEGTEAAAVTAITVRLTAMRPEKSVAMKLDRPFVYAIINNENNEVLFMGKVGNPIKK